MKKPLVLLTTLLFAFFSVFGQKSALHFEILQAKELNIHFEHIVLAEVSADKNVVNYFINPAEVYFYDNTSFNVIHNEVKAMHLVLPVKNGNLILEMVEVPEYFYEYEIITNDGERFPASRDIKYYRGIVKDDFNTIAAFTFCEDEIMGLVCTDEGNFNFVKDSLSGKHIFYNMNNLKERTYPTHHNEDSQSSFVSYPPEIFSRDRTIFGEDGKMILDPSLNKIVKIYIETRYNIYLEHTSSVKKVEKNIFGLFNEVAAIYLNEDIYIGSVCLCIWRSLDPYPDYAEACDILTKFQEVTTSIMNADFGIVLSYRKPNGGCSVLDGLCKPISDRLAAANINKKETITNDYSWSVCVIAHELGHLFGSRHTHACVWYDGCSPIDGCNYSNIPNLNYDFEEDKCGFCEVLPIPPYPPGGGTIMSYCHLEGRPGIKLSLGFGKQPGDLIREKVRNATCLECRTPENISNKTITANCTILGCERLNFQNVTITNNATVKIYAGEVITLKPGFHATAGTNVSISIIPTPSFAPPRNSIVTNNDDVALSHLEEAANIEVFTKEEIHNNPIIKLFPNPNPGTFQLETNFPLSHIAYLKITNPLGVIVHETQNLPSNTVQLAHPVSGLHFVVVILKDGSVLTQKMMIQK